MYWLRSVTELVGDTGYAVVESWGRNQEGSWGQLKNYHQRWVRNKTHNPGIARISSN